MLRLIVSDFDGTLLPYGQAKISDGVIALLRKALQQGITVAVSSGRTVGELRTLLPELADKLWLIGCDGAHYVLGTREYYGKKIEHEDLLIFQKHAGDGLSFVLHAADRNYAVGKLPAAADHFLSLPIRHIDEIGGKVFKVTSYGKKIKLPPYCGLRMHWDGGENASAQYVNRFADKGVALSDLQTRLMMTKFDTACIGDSGNDIAMMHNAKYAVCIGRRSERLQAVCAYSFDSAEEALAELIK